MRVAGRKLRWLPLLLATLASGCRSGPKCPDPEFTRLSHAICQSWNGSQETAEIDFSDYNGPHSVNDYIRLALQQNPAIQAARRRVDASAYRVPVAASLPDPTLNVTVQPEPVQTAAGQQELMISANQKLRWFGKLDTSASIAESQTNVARANLASVELNTIAKVKRAYYELYFVQKAIGVTEADRRLLTQIRSVARARYQGGDTSQQDLLRADLEIANVESELTRLRQSLRSGQARLATLLHIAPQTQLLAEESLALADAPNDLLHLQELAIALRPELHAQFAAIQRERQSVELAKLDYKPDVTLGFSWIDVASAGISPVANGRDAFLLTAGVNLPIYEKRLDASVRSARAKAVATAREYDALRDATLEEVTELFSQAQSQQQLISLLSEDILPKLQQTLELSRHGYNVGEVDFFQLIDDWRKLLRNQINLHRLEASFAQSLAELERVIGGSDITDAKITDQNDGSN